VQQRVSDVFNQCNGGFFFHLLLARVYGGFRSVFKGKSMFAVALLMLALNVPHSTSFAARRNYSIVTGDGITPAQPVLLPPMRALSFTNYFSL
jgi:hypothetical protein